VSVPDIGTINAACDANPTTPQHESMIALYNSTGHDVEQGGRTVGSGGGTQLGSTDGEREIQAVEAPILVTADLDHVAQIVGFQRVTAQRCLLQMRAVALR
jgi:hypothetical protein